MKQKGLTTKASNLGLFDTYEFTPGEWMRMREVAIQKGNLEKFTNWQKGKLVELVGGVGILTKNFEDQSWRGQLSELRTGKINLQEVINAEKEEEKLVLSKKGQVCCQEIIGFIYKSQGQAQGATH